MHTATPGLPPFDYIRPTSLMAASHFLAEHAQDARAFMGGTDIFVQMRGGSPLSTQGGGAKKIKYLVDVKHLDGMGDITFDPSQGLTIGAAVNMNRVIASPVVNQHYPLLAEAARSAASYQLRTRATIVGNLCNASPAGDTTGACIAYGGVLRVHGVQGTREVPLGDLEDEGFGQTRSQESGVRSPSLARQQGALPTPDSRLPCRGFFRGPGRTALEPGDIVTALVLPLPPPGCIGKYIKLGRNALGDLAIVGVTVLGWPDSGAPSGYRFRLALASLAPVPLSPHEAEDILAAKAISEASIAEAAEAAMNACSPIDDVRGSARYRKLMVRNLTQRAVMEVWHGLAYDCAHR